ncbi:piggyBac transposable element-derived protein 4-like [Melanaphis sacchari]|uniref:piggyBac transposable element-derived protein 4-like n=1 Tax=Melanaphis sacchari TaxID=742174 RepID=UPI000DC148FF|nr:piggyBac transposable element-derived protein 4-like [Melanaphis sacchari]
MSQFRRFCGDDEIAALLQELNDEGDAFYNTNDVDPIADFSDDSEVEDEVILPNDHSSESELSVEEEHSSSPQSRAAKVYNRYIELDNEFRSREFKTTTRGEILALIGILFYMATCKTSRANAKSFWKTDGTGMVLFRAAFSYNRFFFLLQCLRFDDLDTRVERQQSDKLAAVREMYTLFNDNNMKNYSPSEFVTIDENMLYAFRGRCSFIQYMPAKPAKYGLKLYALCDAKTFYVYNFEIYCGKQNPGQFLVSNKPFDIVMRLIEPLKTSKRNLTTDNYYGSYPLAQELLKKGITLVTTLKKNKTDIPPGFLPNPKPVILLSTMHDGPGDINEETGKPEIIHDYNKTKSGVDTVDQKCSVASTARNTRRWPLALFFRFLDMAGVNSHILYVANNISMYNYRKFRRLPFLQRLATNLLEEHLKERAKVKGLPKDVQYFLAKYKNEDVCSVTHGENLPKSGACHACGTRKNNKTTVRCSLCTRFVCKKHCTNVIKCHSC